MKLSIIIVNYNVKRFLFQCLRSVEKAIEGLDAEVWVVDNASKDGSLDFLQPQFPKVHFIQNEENVGFSKANNRAIRMSQSDYILLLNPDTIVTTETIHSALDWIENHPETGAVAASMHNSVGAFANESRRGIPTPLVSFCKISGLARLFPKHHIMGRYYMGYNDRHEACNIQILSGAYMFMRRAALEQVGLLDEDFFMYGEDVDLSYRILKGGWKNYYLPNPIIHYKGESEHPSTSRYVNVFHQAMILFYDKHFSRQYPLSGFLIRCAVYMKAFLTLIKYTLRDVFMSKQTKKIGTFWCICDTANRGEIERCAKAMNANIEFISEAKEAYNKGTDDYLLFDCTHVSYSKLIDDIITAFDNEKVITMATWHPEIGILVP